MTTSTDFRIRQNKQLLLKNHQFASDGISKAPVKRLVVVSSRLPITVSKASDGGLQVQPNSEDMVTALSSLLRNNTGLWVGWPGSKPDVLRDGHLDRAGKQLGYTFEPVLLSRFMISENNFDDYYLGFSNKILWPLFHSYPELCRSNSGYWYTYQELNRRFARTVARISKRDDYIWVQDFNLMLLAKELRNIGVNRQTGFFLHTPFPDHNILGTSPWQTELIKNLLEFDLIGFQTLHDRDNFLRCVERITGQDYQNRENLSVINSIGHQTEAGVFTTEIEFFRTWETGRKQPGGRKNKSVTA